MLNDVRVINETTAELQLTGACLVCEGTLELRFSPDGARAFCATCHTIVTPRVRRHPHRGLAIEFRAVGLA